MCAHADAQCGITPLDVMPRHAALAGLDLYSNMRHAAACLVSVWQHVCSSTLSHHTASGMHCVGSDGTCVLVVGTWSCDRLTLH